MDPYGDTDALEAFLSTSPLALTAPTGDEATRLLTRASTRVDAVVTASYSVDSDGIPTDPDVAQALSDACCAQVEFWLEVGEDHDISGLANRQVGIGHLSLAALPPRLAPRAADILIGAGLMAPSSVNTTAAQFFGSCA